MTESSSQGAKGNKRHFQGGSQQRGKGGAKTNKKRKPYLHGKGKRSFKKKNMAKVKCYNCGNKGHFARNCSEPTKVTYLNAHMCAINVSSSVFLTESHPLWIVDSGAQHHVAKDRNVFMEFRRIPYGARWIYVGNNTKAEVKGIGTCKLVMCEG